MAVDLQTRPFDWRQKTIQLAFQLERAHSTMQDLGAALESGDDASTRDIARTAHEAVGSVGYAVSATATATAGVACSAYIVTPPTYLGTRLVGPNLHRWGGFELCGLLVSVPEAVTLESLHALVGGGGYRPPRGSGRPPPAGC